MGEKEKDSIIRKVITARELEIYEDVTREIDRELAYYKLKYGKRWNEAYCRDIPKLARVSSKIALFKRKNS